MGLLTEGPYAQMYPSRRRFPVLQHPHEKKIFFFINNPKIRKGAQAVPFSLLHGAQSCSETEYYSEQITHPQLTTYVRGTLLL